MSIISDCREEIAVTIGVVRLCSMVLFDSNIISREAIKKYVLIIMRSTATMLTNAAATLRPRLPNNLVFTPLSFEIIANSPLGHYTLRRSRRVFKLLSEAAHVDINGSDVALVVVAPYDI